jgi:hypothetical protein
VSSAIQDRIFLIQIIIQPHSDNNIKGDSKIAKINKIGNPTGISASLSDSSKSRIILSSIPNNKFLYLSVALF